MKKAIFLDKNNNYHYALIRSVPNVFLGINTYNLDNEATGYSNIIFHSNNRLYLDTIYCYDKFRSLNIASNINNLAEYILKDYSGYIMRGVYYPSQLSTDRDIIIRSQDELNIRADNFYKSNGYLKLTREEFLCNQDKYSCFSIADDFQLGEELADCIVIKKLNGYSNKITMYNGVLICDDPNNIDTKVIKKVQLL